MNLCTFLFGVKHVFYCIKWLYIIICLRFYLVIAETVELVWNFTACQIKGVQTSRVLPALTILDNVL